MRRSLILLAVSILCILGAQARAQEEPVAKPKPASKKGDSPKDALGPAPEVRYIPDPTFDANDIKPGKTLSLYSASGKVPVAWDVDGYDDMSKALKAGDTKGLEDLANENAMAIEDSPTSVLVIEWHRYFDDPAIEVRLLEGPHKDKAVFVPWKDVQHLIAIKVRKKPGPAAAAAAYKTDQRAADHLRRAKALEKANPKAALKNYRAIVAEHLGSPEAKAAAARIKALEKAEP